MEKIKKITAKATYSVRHQVLRVGKPIETCVFEGDTFPNTHHFGYFENENCVGVLSLFQSDFAKIAIEYQLRGMAVLETHQKKGIGKELVFFAEHFCKENDIPFLWLNARIAALDFYKKMGYTVFGESFTIGDIGLHYKMQKQL